MADFILDPVQTGAHIKELMEAQDMTVRDLQDALGLTCPQTIYRWFYGLSVPSIDHLYSMSRLFHVTVDDLLKGSML